MSFSIEFAKKTGVQWFYANVYKNFDDETLLY